MFAALFKKLFASGDRPAQPRGALADTPPEEPVGPPPFLHREPFLNRQQRIAGYRFSIQHPTGHRAWQASSERFFDQALIDRLGAEDMRRLTGGRPFLIGLRPESLLLESLDPLAPAAPILHLGALELGALEGIEARLNALQARAEGLRERGARLACPASYANGPLDPLLDLASLIVLPVAGLAPPDLLQHIHALRKRCPDAQLMATGVDSVELFDACKRLGFDLFDSRYLTVRQEGLEPNLNSQRMVVSQLISHLRHKDTDIDKLVLIARQDLPLTFRLLRYINSAAMGLDTKVGSLKQAMVYIGREGLYRWLTLLLFYNTKSSPTDDALRETSLGRARMCELLARRRMGSVETEQAFVTGLLSLVDVLFRMPMEQALGQLDLPGDIHRALARHEGKYGALLALTLACEQADHATIATRSAELGLAPEEVNELYLQALTWAVEYDQGLTEDSPGPG